MNKYKDFAINLGIEAGTVIERILCWDEKGVEKR